MEKKIFPILMADRHLALCVDSEQSGALSLAAVKEVEKGHHILPIAPRAGWSQFVALAREILLANPATAEYEEDEPVFKALFDARQEIFRGRGELGFTSQWLAKPSSVRSKAQEARYVSIEEELAGQFSPSGLDLVQRAKVPATVHFPLTTISFRQEGEKVVVGKGGVAGSVVPATPQELIYFACAVLADAETKTLVPEAWAPFLSVVFQSAPEPVASPKTTEVPQNGDECLVAERVEGIGIPTAYVVVA